MSYCNIDTVLPFTFRLGSNYKVKKKWTVHAEHITIKSFLENKSG
jgi:hypothetical protein